MYKRQVLILGSGCCSTNPATVLTPAISIHEAIETDDFAAFSQHLAAGTDVNLKDSRWGNTPLIHASYHGRQKMIDQLVKRGADLDAQSNNGWTALAQGPDSLNSNPSPRSGLQSTRESVS